MKPRIALGIGNTTISFGRSEDGARWPPGWQSQATHRTLAFDPAVLNAHLDDAPVRWTVASVHRPTEKRLAEWIRQTRPGDTYQLLRHTDLELEIDVEIPGRVGMDRLVAAVAVNRLRDPSRPALIIDAGTAMTVDVVDQRGVFRGGVILSGLAIAARALTTFTDLLPEVSADFRTEIPPPIGRSTEEAIRGGLFYGGVGAIRECITEMTAQLGEHPELFVTGGGAEPLVARIPHEHRFVPDLVLAGVLAAAAAE